ncbi:hypothetical protein JYU29_04200 [Tianweitania sp. BSSL-BM11]|uniref:Uncharacterized protein n=1 Tax=Tianweitania aestuarii TaxID=2814886 RepID=A0ABS5RSE4_9HYPH|nr:hypothetical protein [Tianweitania aestuarii]MBS9719887.1 hypothetical protein [Tianweitania aestuarii]
MKVDFALTLDGMLRALRTRLHHVQDELQWNGREDAVAGRANTRRDRSIEMREERDGSRGG